MKTTNKPFDFINLAKKYSEEYPNLKASIAFKAAMEAEYNKNNFRNLQETAIILVNEIETFKKQIEKLTDETTNYIITLACDTFEAIDAEDYERATFLRATKDGVLRHQSNIYSRLYNKDNSFFIEHFENQFAYVLEELIKNN